MKHPYMKELHEDEEEHKTKRRKRSFFSSPDGNSRLPDIHWEPEGNRELEPFGDEYKKEEELDPPVLATPGSCCSIASSSSDSVTTFQDTIFDVVLSPAPRVEVIATPSPLQDAAQRHLHNEGYVNQFEQQTLAEAVRMPVKREEEEEITLAQLCLKDEYYMDVLTNLFDDEPKKVLCTRASLSLLRLAGYAVQIQDCKKGSQETLPSVQQANNNVHATLFFQHDRPIVIEWIQEVVQDLKLGVITLFCACNYLDKHLSYWAARGKLDRNKYQLVACACILIAAKRWVTEEAIPSPSLMLEYTLFAYGIDALRDMEKAVLDTLGWEPGVITPAHFYEHFCCQMFTREELEQLPPSVQEIARVLSLLAIHATLRDTCLIEEFPPSLLAASSILCARRQIPSLRVNWPRNLQLATRYSETDLRVCAQVLQKYTSLAPNPQNDGTGSNGN